jgi:hypothetical protein
MQDSIKVPRGWRRFCAKKNITNASHVSGEAFLNKAKRVSRAHSCSGAHGIIVDDVVDDMEEGEETGEDLFRCASATSFRSTTATRTASDVNKSTFPPPLLLLLLW